MYLRRRSAEVQRINYGHGNIVLPSFIRKNKPTADDGGNQQYYNTCLTFSNQSTLPKTEISRTFRFSAVIFRFLTHFIIITFACVSNVTSAAVYECELNKLHVNEKYSHTYRFTQLMLNLSNYLQTNFLGPYE